MIANATLMGNSSHQNEEPNYVKLASEFVFWGHLSSFLKITFINFSRDTMKYLDQTHEISQNLVSLLVGKSIPSK